MSRWTPRRRVVTGLGVALAAGAVTVAATTATDAPTATSLAAVSETPRPLVTSTESPGLSTLGRLRLALATGPGAGGDPIGAAAASRDGELFRASATGSNDLPAAARRAYRRAAATTAETTPGCGIPWTLLAGIGRVESDHGRFAGSELGADGVSRPAIIGVALDGAGPVAAVPDTDGGRLDGDTVWDRAVGPMQFIPSTWATSGRDGDDDGVADPGDLDDAALASAAYLCRAGGDLSTRSGLRTAVFAYNPSDYYVDLVLAFKRGYDSGDFTIPTPPAPGPTPAPDAAPGTPPVSPQAPPVATPPQAEQAQADQADEADQGDLSADLGAKPPKGGGKGGNGGNGGNGGQRGGNGGQRGGGAAEPVPTDLTGTWTSGETSYRLDGRVLDLTGADVSATSRDYDADGTREAIRDELAGLDGQRVTVTVVVQRDGTRTVTAIRGLRYP